MPGRPGGRRAGEQRWAGLPGACGSVYHRAAEGFVRDKLLFGLPHEPGGGASDAREGLESHSTDLLAHRPISLAVHGHLQHRQARRGGAGRGYHYELAPFGVESATVEPQSRPTPGSLRKIVKPAAAERLASVGELAERAEAMFGGNVRMLTGEDAPDPRDVAEAVVRLVAARLWGSALCAPSWAPP